MSVSRGGCGSVSVMVPQRNRINRMQQDIQNLLIHIGTPVSLDLCLYMERL